MPIAIARLRELIDLAASEGVESLDLVEDGTRVTIRRGTGAPARVGAASVAATPQASAPQAAGDALVSPMFGVLHLTPAPGAAPFARVGEAVRHGQTLCLIEAMKMFTPIVSDRDGRIAAILAEPGEEVARGQPLFRFGS